MKKKLSIVAIIVLVALLALCLVGCDYGDPIEFGEYGRCVIDSGFKSDEGRFKAEMFKTYDEFYAFADENGLLETSTTADGETERPDLNKEFFDEYNIIAIEHGMYSNETATIKKVMVKDSKLTIKYSRSYSESMFTDIVIDIIYVKKTLVENVTECNVTSSSMSFSFG